MRTPEVPVKFKKRNKINEIIKLGTIQQVEHKVKQPSYISILYHLSVSTTDLEFILVCSQTMERFEMQSADGNHTADKDQKHELMKTNRFRK